MSINARCGPPKRKRKDLEMVKKPSITIYNIEDDVDFNVGSPSGRRSRSSTYKVVPSGCEVGERCELIKTTYDAISKYTRAMFDKQSETVV